MKRIICIALALLTVFALCSCKSSKKEENPEVTLHFTAGDVTVCEKLGEEDSAKMIEFLDGNSLFNKLDKAPDCEFDENVGIQIGKRVYAVAVDGSDFVMVTESEKYFSVDAENMDYIRSVFEQYGGYFPCN